MHANANSARFSAVAAVAVTLMGLLCPVLGANKRINMQWQQPQPAIRTITKEICNKHAHGE